MAAVVLTAAAGCGDIGPGPLNDEGVPDPTPTAKVLHEMRTASFPVYWLGPRYLRMKLSSTSIDRTTAEVEYGRPACDSGCSYDLTLDGVPTPRRRDAFPLPDTPRSQWEPVCFRHVRGAVLMGCDDEGDYDLLTGASEISFSLDPSRGRGPDLVRALLPMNPAAATARHFPPPARLSCDEFESFPRWFARKVPRSMRPRTCP